jgi:hypothetical protein
LLQDFLTLDLPRDRFDGIFANASLFHVPSREPPRVLRQLHAALAPSDLILQRRVPVRERSQFPVRKRVHSRVTKREYSKGTAFGLISRARVAWSG